jgi:hypothetical protein
MVIGVKMYLHNLTSVRNNRFAIDNTQFDYNETCFINPEMSVDGIPNVSTPNTGN